MYAKIWSDKNQFLICKCIIKQDRGVINDPLGQIHILASSDHFFFYYSVLLDLKSGDGRTDADVRMDEQMDNMCKNNYHYQPWLWVSRVVQKNIFTMCTPFKEIYHGVATAELNHYNATTKWRIIIIISWNYFVAKL